MKNDKKPFPNSSKSEFSKSSKDTEAAEIARGFDKLGKRAQIRYKLMRARQEDALRLEKKTLKEKRSDLIEVLTIEALNERMRSIHPELKPKFLPRQDRQEQKKLARHDAEAKVNHIEQSKMARMEGKFLHDQKRLLEQEQSRASLQKFNSRAKGGMTFQFNFKTGRKR